MAEPSSETSAPALRRRLDGLTIRDAAHFGRRLKNLRGADAREAAAARRTRSPKAEALVATRQAAVPTITYPDLPVSERRDGDRRRAIGEHQVVVVAGETGSGKTTQLPKICLELGRGIRGTIGHTQPRRLAARTVAQRIADELGTPAGRRGRLHRPLHRPGQRPHPDQADDRRHPARRDPARPPPAALRHADPRRGPRAQPQHRLPARLPARAAAAPPGPEGDRHVGDDRAATLRRALRSARPIVEVSGRTYPVEIRYRPLEVAVPRSGGRRRSRRPRPRDRPHRDPRRDRGDRRRRSTNSRPNRRATCWCSCPASARSATPPRLCAAVSNTPRCCRSTRGCRPPSSRRCSRRTPGAASCWRPTSPRRR